ncbi:MAG TPA: hypothetical protein VFP66_09400 [Candidatus Limnocylindrales bacterium]|nr:hypothetical protein [Candidatus Limnocylindrales bacterium]
MAGTQVLGPAASEAAAPSAVVWINGRQAFVALMSHDGHISTCEISRGWLTRSSYLVQVVRVIGDRQRVVILGPSTDRLALERKYVTMFRRPDRLVDVEPAGPLAPDELVDRLRTLAA